MADDRMKRILVYGNRKTEAQYWDASTPELADKAFLALFKMLDTGWGIYSDLTTPYCPKPTFAKGHPEQCKCGPCWAVRQALDTYDRKSNLHSMQAMLYQQAKGGDASAARKLLNQRKHHEYEEFEIAKVQP